MITGLLPAPVPELAQSSPVPDNLIGSGIQRKERAALLREQIQRRDCRWCLVDLIGEGGPCGRC